VRQRTVYSK